ncbi:hypothetical protein KMZ93_24380 [Bradyrhizobium sediminis]|uniref:Uncharacterized protein n=1 Tax=Bradyrhizobium sediminis TaxID=2840469 RepID=A0A975NX65_9BRAD|nr:hypothetical protein [Bradyrhizobium sediminis]QWG23048.1 hypothetical protein KMZ93_24380 [Bradyrhizobium sediminis]
MNISATLRFLLSVFLPLVWLDGLSPVSAQGVTVESLRGRTITASVSWQTRARANGREFDNPVKNDFVINISGDGKVNATVTRHVIGPRGPTSQSRSFSAVLGKPRDAAGGGALMVLNGNTLTMLRTYETGGAKTTITMGAGGSCTITSPAMKETGSAVLLRKDAVVGGTIEILSSRQVSSSCHFR